jgi:putative nucleotidyltransferase with HDIG domain
MYDKKLHKSFFYDKWQTHRKVGTQSRGSKAIVAMMAGLPKSWSLLRPSSGVLFISKDGFLFRGRPIMNVIGELMKKLQEHNLETYHHSHRVAALALLLANEIGISERDQKALYDGTILHDIGKLKIPAKILTKEQKLTTDEWILIQKHPIFSYELIKPFFSSSEIPYMVLFHHERYNGSGYPFRLLNQDIPIGAMIIAIVDSFDAMTCQRSYNKAKSKEEALIELESKKGMLYPATLINAFVKVMKRETD